MQPRRANPIESSLLITRLDEIGASLAHSPHALALLGLGSVGQELERLDAYSDLDFFVIVEKGRKQDYLNDLTWLSRVYPLAYSFKNTNDGYKLLFSDGIYCEFAVFEPDELWAIPFTGGRVVWKRELVPDTIGLPSVPLPAPARHERDWLLGEALTNLLVGLCRDKRGEKLSALRFIQVYGVERIVGLADYIQPPQAVPQDTFAPERRFEQRHPWLVELMPGWMQGYERNCESALAILAFLEQHFEVDPAIAAAIRKTAEA